MSRYHKANHNLGARKAYKQQAKQAKRRARRDAQQAAYRARQAVKDYNKQIDFLNLGDDLPYAMRSLYADTEAGIGSVPAAVTAMIFTAAIVGGYFLLENQNILEKYNKEKDAHSKTKDELDRTKSDLSTCEKDQQPEQQYVVKKDKGLYNKKDNTKVDLETKAPKKHLYTSKQMQQPFVKNNPPDYVDVGKDRSLDVGVTEESEDMKLEAKNTVPSVSFLANIMPEVVPDKYVNWGVYPDIEEGDIVVAWHLDDSMRALLKSELGIETNADAYVMGYDANLKAVSYFAKEGADGKLTKIADVSGEDKEKIQNHLPDADADDNPGMKEIDAQLYYNAVKDLSDKYDAFQGFLDDYNFNNLSEAKQLVKDLYQLMADYNISDNKNISKLGDMIRTLEGFQAELEEIYEKYMDHNVSDQKSLYKFVDDLLNQSANLSAFLQKHNKTGLPEVDLMIKHLRQNKTRLDDFLEDLNEKYGVKNETDLYEYVQDLQDNITALEERIRELGAPFTIENITKDANSTTAWDLIRKQADRAGLDTYRLDLTNNTQLSVVREIFGDAVVDKWLADGIVKAEIVDGLDTGNDAAAVALKDKDHLQYTEAIKKATWKEAKEALEDYMIDEY